MTACILDGSVTMTWCFRDEARADCDALQAELLGPKEALVPQHWAMEVANSIVMGERRQRATPASAKIFVEMLENLNIAEDRESRKRAFSDGLELARRYSLTVYDALYLELALRMNLPLWTLDKDLRKAARSAGVECFPQSL